MLRERILDYLREALEEYGFFPKDGSPRQQGYSWGSEEFADTRVRGGGPESVTTMVSSNLEPLSTCLTGKADQPPIDSRASQ